jgi:hypothetical protein
MSEVAGVITAQVDLLWSVALALLVAEVYLLARFLAGGLGLLGPVSKFLLVLSVAALGISMLFGYLTYGAVVEMVRTAAENGDPKQSYADAAFSAVVQFVGFALGLLAFLVAFFLNARSFGKAMNDDKG